MRKRTKDEIAIHLLGAAIGAGLMASALLVGMRVRAAEAEPLADLRTIAQAELVDLRAAEPYEAPAPETAYSQEDLDLLAAIIYAEAGDQDFIGMRLVGDCVCNRMRSSDPYWPDTVSGVVYQAGQFSPVTDGGLDRAWGNVTEECYEAARLALSGDHIDDQVMFFSMYYCANGTFAYQHGDHFFGY